ncbi:hypothetical protein [Marinobacterium halophilum]|uniref:hypothetical protein n=1 Tax=Marinobacterium halophilum TaxID=267374 RepID=UPI0011B24A0E|nr:hypothetical protein [Marinobacterium halophilum]
MNDMINNAIADMTTYIATMRLDLNVSNIMVEIKPNADKPPAQYKLSIPISVGVADTILASRLDRNASYPNRGINESNVPTINAIANFFIANTRT